MTVPFFCSEMFIKTVLAGGTDVALFNYVAYTLACLCIAALPAVLPVVQQAVSGLAARNMPLAGRGKVGRPLPQVERGRAGFPLSQVERGRAGFPLPMIGISTFGAALLCAAYAVMIANTLAPTSYLLYLAALMGSFGITVCYAKWFSLYTTVPLRTATFTMLLSWVMGQLLRLVASYLTPLAGLCLALVLVSAMQVCFVRLMGKMKPAPPGQACVQAPGMDGLGARFSPRHLLPFILALMLYSLVLALVRAATATEQYLLDPNSLNLMLRMAFPLLLLVFVAPKRPIIRFTSLYQISLILVVTAVLIVKFLISSHAVWAVALTSFIRGMIVLFFWLTLVQIVQSRRREPFTVFGIGLGVYIFAQGLGLFVSKGLGFSLDGDATLNIIYILVVLSLLALLVIEHNSRTDSNGAAVATDLMAPDGQGMDGIEGAPGEGRGSLMAQAGIRHPSNPGSGEVMASLRKRYGLTDRETEILEFICQGRSKRYIAETLVISENTVRGYAKSLHAKCGVHSKQELIDLCVQETR
jgi:DNA-binding CsgD family transcriptional regulator